MVWFRVQVSLCSYIICIPTALCKRLTQEGLPGWQGLPPDRLGDQIGVTADARDNTSLRLQLGKLSCKAGNRDILQPEGFILLGACFSQLRHSQLGPLQQCMHACDLLCRRYRYRRLHKGAIN
jgi:hypothetical protein